MQSARSFATKTHQTYLNVINLVKAKKLKGFKNDDGVWFVEDKSHYDDENDCFLLHHYLRQRHQLRVY